MVGPASANPGLEDWSKPTRPARGDARVYGSAAAGCLVGAVRLPSDGIGYQAVRVSRNRHWGHPSAVEYMTDLGRHIERAGLAPVYVGDMSQPRGGPMAFGHTSHQTGLDIDIWFSLLPKPDLEPAERENPPLPSLVTRGQDGIDGRTFVAGHVELLRLAAAPTNVDRIFVHWQIKKRLCEIVDGDRGWLRRIRPWYGHDSHFHVRLACPSDSPACLPQAPLPSGDGCGEELDWWLTVAADRIRGQRPTEQTGPPRPRMPAHCATVYRAR